MNGSISRRKFLGAASAAGLGLAAGAPDKLAIHGGTPVRSAPFPGWPEIRENDERITTICERLNHFNTQQCVTAERAFLHAMGGGCQSPVAAYAQVTGAQLRMRALSFADGATRRAEGKRTIREAVELGQQLAAELKQS